MRSFSAAGSDDAGAAATAVAVGTARATGATATAVATGGAGGVGPRGANGGGVGGPGVTGVAAATGTVGAAGGAGGGNVGAPGRAGAAGATGNFGAPGGPGAGGGGVTLPEDPSGGLSAHGGAGEVLPDTEVDLREDMVLGVVAPNLFAPNVGCPSLEVELAAEMPRPAVGFVPDSGGIGGVPVPLVPAAGARGGCGVDDCAFGAEL